MKIIFKGLIKVIFCNWLFLFYFKFVMFWNFFILTDFVERSMFVIIYFGFNFSVLMNK